LQGCQSFENRLILIHATFDILPAVLPACAIHKVFDLHKKLVTEKGERRIVLDYGTAQKVILCEADIEAEKAP